MSPEAVRGERLDLRSDLYSLGATLYHAAAGHPPFPGPYVEAVYAAQLSAPPPPLDKRRDLDPALKAALFRLLDKDPARRFQHPAEWVAALERVPDGAGSPAAPASAPSAPS
jgi:serine/threonine-protein kinase